jgi:hypothetical protein
MRTQRYLKATRLDRQKGYGIALGSRTHCFQKPRPMVVGVGLCPCTIAYKRFVPLRGPSKSPVLCTGLFTGLANDQTHNNSWYLYNNLFRGGSISYRICGATPVAIAYDNFFDSTSVTNLGTVNFTSGYNGYVTNYTRFSGSQGNDRVLSRSPVYQTSYLGNNYYPTNDGMLSTLIDAGSRLATDAGLFYFTTTTNQVEEGATTVDIGFHYVEPVPIEQSHAELGWDRRGFDLKPRELARWH